MTVIYVFEVPRSLYVSMLGESQDHFKLSGWSYFSSGFGDLRHEMKCGFFFSFSDDIYNLHRSGPERVGILAKCLEHNEKR